MPNLVLVLFVKKTTKRGFKPKSTSTPSTHANHQAMQAQLGRANARLRHCRYLCLEGLWPMPQPFQLSLLGRKQTHLHEWHNGQRAWCGQTVCPRVRKDDLWWTSGGQSAGGQNNHHTPIKEQSGESTIQRTKGKNKRSTISCDCSFNMCVLVIFINGLFSSIIFA